MATVPPPRSPPRSPRRPCARRAFSQLDQGLSRGEAVLPVPVREIALAGGEAPLQVYDPSSPAGLRCTPGPPRHARSARRGSARDVAGPHPVTAPADPSTLALPPFRPPRPLHRLQGSPLRPSSSSSPPRRKSASWCMQSCSERAWCAGWCARRAPPMGRGRSTTGCDDDVPWRLVEVDANIDVGRGRLAHDEEVGEPLRLADRPR